VERKLAAILAADVVGYSAHMERDEAGTFARLKAGREQLFEPEIARHHGRVFKVMGDGMLAEFGSVVDAVECAVALQRGLAERNAHVPESERIAVRIGINLGEVIVEGDDRYGEGVNVAARLEQLAEPGGIWVSGKVAKEVEKKLAFGFEPMGEQRVKNIAEPVAAYRVRLDALPAGLARSAWSLRLRLAAAAVGAVLVLAGGAAWFKLSVPTGETVAATGPGVAEGKPSLVVLPFANLSDDKEQGYLADGITEDLTTELARVPGLFVVSRNAALTYKGKATQPAQIAKDLGVRYILEGSARRAGEETRLNAQLIDAQTGGHVWAERFDGDWAQIFELQDKVVTQIAGALKLRLLSGQSVMSTPGGTQDPAAYEAYLRAVQFLESDDPASWAKAIAQYERALALDPAFGRAAAELSDMYRRSEWAKSRLSAIGITQDDARARKAHYFDLAAKNPSATYYRSLAEILVNQFKWDEAIAAAARSIALDPSDPLGYEQMSWCLTLDGKPSEGRENFEAARRIDPQWYTWPTVVVGLSAFSQERFAEAAALLEKLDDTEGESVSSNFWPLYYGRQLQIAAYGHLDRRADAAALVERLEPFLAEAFDEELTGLLTMTLFPFRNLSDTQRLLAGLRKAGVPELPRGYDPASEERLSGEEIRSLVVGHTLAYRNIGREPSMTASTVFTSDGRATLTRPDGTIAGTFQVDSRAGDETFCISWDRFGIECVAVFRNPDGKAADQNEFLWINAANPWSFSVVK
jgi:TolB-like protein/class 3 adenylate cyclase